MDKQSRIELSKMQSLMERMDNHYTKSESEILTESRLINEGLAEKVDRANEITLDGNTYKLDTPERLIQALTKKGISPQKPWYVTIGYVSKYDKFNEKNIRSAVDSFAQDDIDNARSIGSDRLNNILDNPTTNKKGQITNPYMTDSYTNYVVEVAIIKLMYGRNAEWGEQKNRVRQWGQQYQQDNPDEVQKYMDAKGIVDFAGQMYDDSRASYGDSLPNVNGKQKFNGGYELNFNTPKTVFKKLATKYFVIKDADNIEEISKEEAEAYARLFGVATVKRINTDPDEIKKIDNEIKKIKAQEHGENVWTNYSLDSVFLMNFSEGDNSEIKLQYYNPNAIVEFVKGRELKSGTVPSQNTTAGVFSPHFDKLRQNY